MNFENYQSFINEQRDYFLDHIQSDFNNSWEDTIWVGGNIGSGWLLSRTGKTYFNFESIKKIKGIKDLEIDKEFQVFMKAILVLSYRKSNNKASPQKLYAELLILKRWYSALIQNKSNKHPCSLNTEILNISFECLAANSSKTNLPDHAGSYFRIQEMINHYSFTEQALDFSKKYKYINAKNRTPNAKKTKALIDQLELNDEDIETEKLISVRTFINIVSLINLCQTNSEKIALNFLLLLIVTGLRSTEAILLKKDALIKKPVLDPATKEHLALDGIKQYTLGIRYHGAKGAGFRIHWLEPLAANLVETIFESVIQLTEEYRNQILYIKAKNYTDFLPRELDEIPSDEVELDDLVNTIFRLRDKNEYKGITNYRNILQPSLKHVPLSKQVNVGQRVKKFYLKKDIDNYIRSLTPNLTSDFPFVQVFNYEGKLEKIPFEDLLFIHEFKSLNLKRQFSHKTNIIPLTCITMINFLGGRKNLSVFEKYNLKENENEFSKISTHVPRHNINTFLAISGLSEHLQAILMGRIDIKQNQYYQHLALKQRKVAASMLEKKALVLAELTNIQTSSAPLASIQKDGLMYFSKSLDLENNLKMNLQSFDSRNEVSSYIKESFFAEYFDDIADAFNELSSSDPKSADLLVQRHAYLHPLSFGGCMRDIAFHDCPKRLACQSGYKCGNFSLTGRKGELENLQLVLNNLIRDYENLVNSVQGDNSYSEMLEELSSKIFNLKNLKETALLKRNNLIPIQIFDYFNESSKLPATLSELFAIEQQKLESSEV